MADESEQNKSEQPTRYKLQQARRKGAVARGADLGFFVALSVALAFVTIVSDSLSESLVFAMRRTIALAAQSTLSPAQVGEIFAAMGSAVTPPLLIFVLAVFASVLLFELVQTGFVFAPQALRLDFSRLDIAKGLKRVLSPQVLIEGAKTILKAIAYCLIAYLAFQATLPKLLNPPPDPRALGDLLFAPAIRTLGFFVLAALAFAALDQVLSRRAFLKKMRMSRRDVRREHRDQEGDPHQKQKRKRLHADFGKNSQSLRGVRGADLLLVNPTHVAIGLRYEKSAPAPKVVASGVGPFAARLKRLALLYGVPIIEDRPLAHALVRTSLHQMIPETAYARVADHYVALRQRPGADKSARHD